MLKNTVRKHRIKSRVSEGQMTRIADDVMDLAAKLRCDATRRHHRAKRWIDADGLVSGLRGRHRPSAPAATDVEQQLAASIWKRKVGNGIAVERSDQVAVHQTIRGRDEIRDHGIDLAAAICKLEDATFFILVDPERFEMQIACALIDDTISSSRQ